MLLLVVPSGPMDGFLGFVASPVPALGAKEPDPDGAAPPCRLCSIRL